MINNQLTSVFSKLRSLDEIPMNVKTRYYISKVSSYVTNKLQPYFAAEQELVKKYGIKDESGEYKTSENGGILLSETAECRKEYNELQLIEVDVSDAPKISIDCLIDANLTLTELEMKAFENFIA